LTEYRFDDVLACRVESLACRRTEFLLHLFLHARFGRGRGRFGLNRWFVVLLSTGGKVRVHAQLLQPLDRFFAEVAVVRRIGNRHGRAVCPLRSLDPCRVQVVQGRLRHRDGLLLVIRRVGRFRRHDDLFRAVHHRLTVVGIIESLVALLHDLRFGVGEVRLRLVLGGRVDGSGFFTPALAAFGFTLGLFLVTAVLFFFRLGEGLGFWTRLRLLDLRQPFLTPRHFVRLASAIARSRLSAGCFPCSCTRTSSPCAAKHSPPSSSRRWIDSQA